MAARGKTFARAWEILVVVCLLLLATAQSLWAQPQEQPGRPQYVITRIAFDWHRQTHGRSRENFCARMGNPRSCVFVTPRHSPIPLGSAAGAARQTSIRHNAHRI